MKGQSLPGGFPYGTLALFVLAFFLYIGLVVNVLEMRRPGADAAGRGMAEGFAAMLGIALWIVLGTLLAVAAVRGRMPGYAAIAAFVLVPLSAMAAATATELYSDGRYGSWLIAVPLLLPPLLALYALWSRLPAWHDALPAGPTTTVLGGVILVVTIVPLALAKIESMPNPERDAARNAQAQAFEVELRRQEQAAAAENAARFNRLGPDSPLADYLEYLWPGDPRFQEAVAGARLVKSRDQDAVTLLREGRIGDLTELWRLAVDPAAVCDAYGTALRIAVGRISPTRSDFRTPPFAPERQLPNIEWLVGAHCGLTEALAEVERLIRAVTDSPDLNAFADTLADLRQQSLR
jgi:hypothetical protein